MDGVEILDRRFKGYILDNAALETLATGFRWIEGPVWMGDAGCLLFQDLPRDRTMRWSEETGISVYRAPSAYANGQTRDRQGRLIACSHQDRCLYRTEWDGSVTKLVDAHAGKRLNAPNDVVVSSDGAIWFSDPLYGISNDYEGGRQVSEQPPALYRFDPASGEIRVMASDFTGPNGLAFSPDERRLYVAETGDQTQPDPVQHIRVFDMAPGGLGLSGGEVFHTITPGYCDGLRVDEHGNIWSSAADGVHCLSPDGALLGKVLVPHRVSNLCFGGATKNRLFIGGSHTLYSIFLNHAHSPEQPGAAEARRLLRGGAGVHIRWIKRGGRRGADPRRERDRHRADDRAALPGRRSRPQPTLPAFRHGHRRHGRGHGPPARGPRLARDFRRRPQASAAQLWRRDRLQVSRPRGPSAGVDRLSGGWRRCS
jgi:gluconolactonase